MAHCTAQNEPERLSNPILTQRQHEHEQALSFLTYLAKRRRDWGTGKATQRETFIVISTLCVCCASPAACCWCRVPAAFF